MTHSWEWWGSLEGVRHSPALRVLLHRLWRASDSSEALSPPVSKANPAPSDWLFDFLTCGLFPAGPGPVPILLRLDPPPTPSPDPYSLAPMML